MDGPYCPNLRPFYFAYTLLTTMEEVVHKISVTEAKIAAAESNGDIARRRALLKFLFQNSLSQMAFPKFPFANGSL